MTTSLKILPGEICPHSIRSFCETYRIGKTTAYAEIKAGRLRTVKLGRRTLILPDSVEAWLKTLSTPLSTLRSERRRTAANLRGDIRT